MPDGPEKKSPDFLPKEVPIETKGEREHDVPIEEESEKTPIDPVQELRSLGEKKVSLQESKGEEASRLEQIGLIIQEGVHDQLEKLDSRVQSEIKQKGAHIRSMIDVAIENSQFDETIVTEEIYKWLFEIGFDDAYARAEARSKTHSIRERFVPITL